MITLQELIKNELELWLNHEPTIVEMNALSEHLAPIHFNRMMEIDKEIGKWVDKNTVPCAWCGERYMPIEMIQTAGHVCFCCDQCKKDYQQEHPIAE